MREMRSRILCAGFLAWWGLAVSLAGGGVTLSLQKSNAASGTLSWQGAPTNGLVTVETLSRSASNVWLPLQNTFTSKDAGALTVPLTNSPTLFRASIGDTATNPPGMKLIPAGYFQMGDNYGEGAAIERPVHSLYVRAFYIGQFEVTNRQMRDALQWAYTNGYVTTDGRLVKGTASGLAFQDLHQDDYTTNSTRYWSGIWFTNSFGLVEGRENQPCIDVSWYGAAAYCVFRSLMEGLQPCFNLTNFTCDFTRNGYRLPTEAEWEKAARGGQTGHHYPWPSYGGGYSSFITTNMANWTPPTLPHPFHMQVVGYYNGNQVPAGPDMVNGYGLYDMAGNAREWCYDWYAANWYSQPAANEGDTVGPESGDIVVFGSVSGPGKVTRGGSFDLGPSDLRVGARNYQVPVIATAASWYNGFRVVVRR